jgi:hypothetical protein
MEVLVESEDLSHAAIRPPVTHRLPVGARPRSGRVPGTPPVRFLRFAPPHPGELAHLAAFLRIAAS